VQGLAGQELHGQEGNRLVLLAAPARLHPELQDAADVGVRDPAGQAGLGLEAEGGPLVVQRRAGQGLERDGLFQQRSCAT
jgi:hypothetical protein